MITGILEIKLFLSFMSNLELGSHKGYSVHIEEIVLVVLFHSTVEMC